MRTVTTLFSFSFQRIVAAVQYLASGLVSFARGLNDTLKVAGALVSAMTSSSRAYGIDPSARRPGDDRIGCSSDAARWSAVHSARRENNVGRYRHDGPPLQGLLTSAVTALLVLPASFGGLPVSTTHVAVGALFGIGLGNVSVRITTIGTITTAWVTTVPIAAVCEMGAHLAMSL